MHHWRLKERRGGARGGERSKRRGDNGRRGKEERGRRGKGEKGRRGHHYHFSKDQNTEEDNFHFQADFDYKFNR